MYGKFCCANLILLLCIVERIQRWGIISNCQVCRGSLFRILPKWLLFFLEPDYDFEKPLTDADAYEKETAEFECEVNDEEAQVQWYREDKVCCRRTELLEFI